MSLRRSRDGAVLDAELSAGLAAAVRRLAGARAEVVGVHRTLSPYATVSPSEVVSVELAGGEAASIFVKHLGGEQRDHPDKLVREREARVYGELLGDSSLPVPRFLGAHPNGTTGRLELFLEYVDGWSLKYREMRHWHAAARRLARLHLEFSGRADDLRRRGFLLRLDRAYLLAWAGRAIAAVSSLSTELAGQLRPTVDALGVAADLLDAQAPTLVHNDLAPKNVIADTTKAPDRTCIVDWEMAGTGCGLIDLSHLTYGLPQDEVDRMFDLYCGELRGTGLVPSHDEGRRLFAACQLHGALYRLAHAGEWRLPLERVAEWIVDCQQLNREILR